MKKIILLPLVMIIILLSGCGSKSSLTDQQIIVKVEYIANQTKYSELLGTDVKVLSVDNHLASWRMSLAHFFGASEGVPDVDEVWAVRVSSSKYKSCNLILFRRGNLYYINK